jgi:hypothetical protein
MSSRSDRQHPKHRVGQPQDQGEAHIHDYEKSGEALLPRRHQVKEKGSIVS